MADKPFVINDRRKFTSEGELREEPSTPPAASTEAGRADDEPTSDAGKPHREPIAFPGGGAARAPSPEPGRSEDEPAAPAAPTARPAAHEPIAFPSSSASSGTPAPEPAAGPDAFDEAALPPLTAEQTEQAARAYDATVDRLDTAIRAQNLGAERMPEMNFERVVQSLYMQALMQLGGAAEPGQPPQVDVLGARQTIDMLAVIVSKTTGNLSEPEAKLTENALFELRMGFLEITQALARQAAAKHPGGPMPGSPRGPLGGGPGGPKMVS